MNIEFKTEVTPERVCVGGGGRDSHVIREAALVSP